MSDYHVLFCQMYEQKIEATKTPEQVLLLKYLKAHNAVAECVTRYLNDPELLFIDMAADRNE